MLSFQRQIRRGVIAVVAHPRSTLLIAGLLLVGCIALAFTRLSVNSDEGKLFSTTDSHFRESYDFNTKFPENDALYVVVEAVDPKSPPPLRRWTELADRITAQLKQMPGEVDGVQSRVPLDQLGSQAMLFDEPANVKEHVEGLKRFMPLVRLWGEKPDRLSSILGPTPMSRFISGMLTQAPDAERAQFIGLLAQSWQSALEQPSLPLVTGKALPDFAAFNAEDPSDLGYFYVNEENDKERKMLLIQVYPKVDYSSQTAISTTVESIRTAINGIAKDYPEFTVGTTGRPALSADEMKTTDEDSKKSEIVAMCVIFILLWAMLRSFWIALAAEISLATAIGWTFGWATLTLGELNLLSLVFLIALIGIGMDYLVQVLMAYRREARRRVRPMAVWTKVFRSIAPPINTACLGAAGAFLASIFTNFRGAAELGIIAGGGLLLCLLAGYTVLPALLTLFPPRLKLIDSTERYSGKLARAGGWRLAFPAAWVACLLIGIWPATRTKFNSNLLDMQVPHLPSVKLVQKLQSWNGVVLSKDLKVLQAARKALEGSPLVKRTESILSAYDNYDWLAAQRPTLPKVDWIEPAAITADEIPSLILKLRTLADHLAGAPITATTKATTSPTTYATTTSTRATSGPAATAIASLRESAQLLETAGDEDAPKLAARLSAWQSAFAAQLKSLLEQLNPSPLEPGKLPVELRGHLLCADGTYALYFYPKDDLWSGNTLQRFVDDVEARTVNLPGSPVVTGIAVSVYHSTKLIQHSFYAATFYALALIVALVLIDLRNIRQTLLAISVLALGLPVLVALMGLLQIDWNLANFFGLPILIGAGHEYGVFLVHRYREALHDPHRAWRVWDHSDRALLLCALVTCSSFGFFWALGSHRGLKSLGLVMALGTACIYLAAVLVLRPLLLYLLSRKAVGGRQYSAARNSDS